MSVLNTFRLIEVVGVAVVGLVVSIKLYQDAKNDRIEAEKKLAKTIHDCNLESERNRQQHEERMAQMAKESAEQNAAHQEWMARHEQVVNDLNAERDAGNKRNEEVLATLDEVLGKIRGLGDTPETQS